MGNLSSTSWGSSKYLFVKHLFCYFIKNIEVRANFTFFGEAELVKFGAFGR
jgi:hypothetical protein